MTGTGRRRWLVGAGVLVAVAVTLAVWVVLRDGDGDDGTDSTPPAELIWVGRLADLGRVDEASRTSPEAIGAGLGEVVARLATRQDTTAFTAEYGIGPADMASQLATALASIMNDVSPPSACGNRATEMRTADTQFVLGVSAAAVAVIERDQDPPAVAALILPAAIEGDQRETIAERIATGEIEAAATAIEDELGDDAARLVVVGLVEELHGVLASDDEADYLGSFQATYNFARNVLTTGTDCG